MQIQSINKNGIKSVTVKYSIYLLKILTKKKRKVMNQTERDITCFQVRLLYCKTE